MVKENAIFRGLYICSTGLDVYVKEQLRKIVVTLGGEFDDDLASDTTHLIANKVGSKKCQVAMEWKVPVVRSSWVFDSFRDHQLLDPSVYSLRILEGLVLCTTGLSESLRDQVARISCLHGATYNPNMEIGKTDLLLAQRPGGAKYDAAMEYGVPVIHLSWLHACLDHESYVSEDNYLLDKVYQQSSKIVHQQKDPAGQKNRQLEKDIDSLLLGLTTRQQQHDKEMFLLDDCVFYLHGFTEQVDASLNVLIRSCMGTRLQSDRPVEKEEFNLSLLTHVIVHYDTNPKELDNLKRHLMKKCPSSSSCQVYFISPKWFIDTLKCQRIQPEGLYPVETNVQEETEQIFQVVDNTNTTINTSIKKKKKKTTTTMTIFKREVSTTTNTTDEEKEDEGHFCGSLFHKSKLLLLCVNNESIDNKNKWLSSIQDKLNQSHTNYQFLSTKDFFSLFEKKVDIQLIEEEYHEFTHLVVCHGVQFTKQQAKWLTQYKLFCQQQPQPQPQEQEQPQPQPQEQDGRQLQQRQRCKWLKFVSDIWLASCLAANFMFPRSVHSLFPIYFQLTSEEEEIEDDGQCSMDYYGDLSTVFVKEDTKETFVGGSLFPAQLPMSCFNKMVASISVYMGVERIVCQVVLEMVGAKVTSKMSKRVNTHLICLKQMGMKFEKAKEWSLQIGNLTWILQCIQQQKLIPTTN